MDQAAEPVTPTEPIKSGNVARNWLLGCCRQCERRPLVEQAVRPVLVVVQRVCGNDAFEVAASEDKEPVEALAPQRPDPALGVCSRPRRPV